MQMMRNQGFDVSLQQSPYKAMFGCKAKLGQYSSYPRKLTVLQTKEEPEIAEEELQNSLCIRQEERAEIGTERSDMVKDIHPTPPKATEPSISQGPRSLLVNRHLLHGHSWCLWALVIWELLPKAQEKGMKAALSGQVVHGSPWSKGKSESRL